ncbi:MAG: D-alanyl-D-alanine carboxypeptidase family protein, partial [Acutalibacteraceae bacterium]
GNLSLKDEVVTSEHASSMGGSDIWLEVGEIMTVDEMLKATLVASANDASVALAEKVCGSEEDFVKKMNERAKSLSMNDTTFKNCNGLDEDGHLTSAYDVAIMSRELVKHKKVFDYTTIWLDTLRGGETQIVNTNKLLKTYDGMKGLKTGTTSEAGSCFSAYAERNGISFIAVVLGCDSGTDRFKDTSILLDYGFANYSNVAIDLKEKPKNIAVKNGMKNTAKVEAKMGKSLMLPKGSAELSYTVKMKKEISAPVKKGTVVGKVIIKSGNKKVGEYDIITKENVKKSTFSSNFAYVFSKLTAL